MFSPFFRIVVGYYIVAQYISAVMLLVGMILLLNSACNRFLTFTKIFMIALPILQILRLFAFPNRVGYLLGLIYFAAALIAFVVLLKYAMQKRKNGKSLRENIAIDAIVPLLLAFYLLTFSVIDLFEMIEDCSDHLGVVALITALVCALLAVVLCFILKKGCNGFKMKLKSAAISFGAGLGCGLLLAFLIIPQINYAFDFSKGQPQRFEILDKEFQTDASQYSVGDDYYLIINRNGKEERLRVTAERYQNSEVGDYVNATLCDGFLGMAYLEYE